METRPTEAQTPAPTPAKSKLPYTAPTLTVHGTVEEITKALGPGTKDALTGSALL